MKHIRPAALLALVFALAPKAATAQLVYDEETPDEQVTRTLHMSVNMVFAAAPYLGLQPPKCQNLL